FFLAGKNIPWWAAAFSGIATIVSAISYLGAPGQAFRADLTFLQYRLTTPLALVIICLVFIPFFHRLDLFTAYEYLERRFDLKTRLLASALFVLFKCAFLGIGIYAPALVVAEIMHVPIPAIILGVGLLTTAYTMLGGMRAVIWTDTLQLSVLLSGLAVTAYVILSSVDGGLSAVMATATSHGKLRFFDLTLDLTTELTLWASLLGGTVLLLSQYGVDQAEMQRFLTTRSVRTSQAAIASAMVFSALVGLLLFFIGIGLYAFYVQFPEKGGFAVAPDRVFPKFIVEELPPGLTGLLLAGVFAAGMSTISSILHSLTTVVMSDFYGRLRGRPASVAFARLTTIGFGVLCTGLALVADRLGSLLVASTTVNNLFGGPLVGIFLLGMLTRRANGSGACLGATVGFLGAVALASFTNVSWMWYGAVSATATFVTGLALSAAFAPPDPQSVRLVYRGATAREEPVA
ncbi:MAG TPA: sodium/solute symporter, partial [Vicinamibacterales bacterium]